jgi:hypothetical protein
MESVLANQSRRVPDYLVSNPTAARHELRTPEESQIKSCEHQENANIRCQPFPESVSKKQEIYTDYKSCHRHHVKQNPRLSAHSRFLA